MCRIQSDGDFLQNSAENTICRSSNVSLLNPYVRLEFSRSQSEWEREGGGGERRVYWQLNELDYKQTRYKINKTGYFKLGVYVTLRANTTHISRAPAPRNTHEMARRYSHTIIVKLQLLILINLDGLSMLIICMIPLEKLDKCGLMLANPDRDLYTTSMWNVNLDLNMPYDLSRKMKTCYERRH